MNPWSQPPPPLSDIWRTLQVKPRVFVSYHHGNDQTWYDRFSTVFGAAYNVITDRSLQRKIDSADANYTRRKIREDNVTGTSVTVVLCGEETWKRRWVDWEIHMTLNKQHALLGVVLPAHTIGHGGLIIVPDRLHANVASGYANWIHWTEDPGQLSAAIGIARERAKQARLIDNSAPLMQRSRS